MTCLNRDQFLKSVDRKKQRVDLPEFGEDSFVFVRELGVEDLRVLMKHQDDSIEAMIHVVLQSVSDESGNLILSPEDVDQIKQKSNAVLKRLADTALQISGLVADDDAKKN